MKERPILFSAAMVVALLAGRKTQTRRIGKLQSDSYVELGTAYQGHQTKGKVLLATYKAFPNGGTARWAICECPYGIPGDRLWVRETWCNGNGLRIAYPNDGITATGAPAPKVIYKADEIYNLPPGTKWRPSIFMPRWASRITLEITAVRVERLSDINEEDAKAEGVFDLPDSFKQQAARIGLVEGKSSVGAIDYFRQLWESIHGPGSWDANPWVWVIEFRRVQE